MVERAVGSSLGRLVQTVKSMDLSYREYESETSFCENSRRESLLAPHAPGEGRITADAAERVERTGVGTGGAAGG